MNYLFCICMPICCMTLVNKDNKRFFLSTTFVLCLMVLFSYGELAFQWELNRSISTRFNPIFVLGRIHTLLFILYQRNYLHDKIKCISSYFIYTQFTGSSVSVSFIIPDWNLHFVSFSTAIMKWYVKYTFVCGGSQS